MAVEANKQYRIRNRSGMVVDVPGSILAELALANEPVRVVEGDDDEGVLVRDYVSESVAPERADEVREAHRQSNVNPILDDPQADRERVAELRKHEVDDALLRAVAVKERPVDQREDPALAPLLGSGENVSSEAALQRRQKDSDSDGVPDSEDPDSTWSTGDDKE